MININNLQAICDNTLYSTYTENKKIIAWLIKNYGSDGPLSLTWMALAIGISLGIGKERARIKGKAKI